MTDLGAHDHIEEFDFRWVGRIKELASEAERISAQWNGDDSGTLEDLAHMADEIEELATKIAKVLEDECI